jgi:hypothetical protein
MYYRLYVVSNRFTFVLYSYTYIYRYIEYIWRLTKLTVDKIHLYIVDYYKYKGEARIIITSGSVEKSEAQKIVTTGSEEESIGSAQLPCVI